MQTPETWFQTANRLNGLFRDGTDECKITAAAELCYMGKLLDRLTTERGSLPNPKRRAANALIAMMDAGEDFREVLETAMNDTTASEYARTRLAGLHDTLFG